MFSGIDSDSSGILVRSRKIIFRWLFYTLFGVLLLSVDPFNIGSFAEEGSQRVLFEIGGPLYSSDARDDITIILVTESSLKALYNRKITGTNEWPLLYQDWSVLLKAIAAHNPRSLFVDVYFEQERVTDGTLPVLESALQRIQRSLPVYFAAGTPPYDSDLLRRLDGKADLVGSAWQGFGHGVPLQQMGEPMAALQLYRDACGASGEPLAGCGTNTEWTHAPEVADSAMSIVWGSTAALPLTAELEGFSRESYCSNNTASLFDLGRGVLKSAAGDLWEILPFKVTDEGQQCLFHRVIDAEELMLVFDHGSPREREVLRSALENKVVMLGTYFEGLPDTIETPTMGRVPGVALHAMMLDNLMKYGPDYIRTAGLNTLPYNGAVWSVIVMVLVLWIARREHQAASQYAGGLTDVRVPFTGWDSTIFLAISLLLTSLAAFSTYYFFRFEPANAIGFLGLAELTRRIYGKVEA